MGYIRNWAKQNKINFRKIILRVIIFFFVASIGLVCVFRFVPVFVTPLMVIRSVSSIFADRFIGIEKKWVAIKDISPAMQAAVLKAEDSKFYEHGGFDFEAIEKAYAYNKTHLKKKGASTITQQTAKNVFLWPSRSWTRKALEAYFAVLIEMIWTKERILEVYLNVIELGPGVYGVEAASQKYFDRNSKSLNRDQASIFAAVLPNPNRFLVSRPSAYVRRRQQRILLSRAPAVEKPSLSRTPF